MSLTIGQMRGALVDGSTKKLSTIDYHHHEIHEGSAYMLSQITAVDALDTQINYRVQCPVGTTHLHMVISADLADSGFLEVFEDNDIAGQYVVSAGTLVRPKNNNRNFADASIATVRENVTIGAASNHCRIYCTRMGGKKLDGSMSLRREIVLKSGGDYLIRLSSDANNNEGSLELEWYEHTDRS